MQAGIVEDITTSNYKVEYMYMYNIYNWKKGATRTQLKMGEGKVVGFAELCMVIKQYMFY